VETWNFVLNLVTLAAVAVGGWLVTAIQSSIRTAGERLTEIEIDNRTFAARLEQELQRTRATERQELRFAAYGSLWAAMRPLAIYDAGAFGPREAAQLSTKLSDWYFSEHGGLLLTRTVRDVYFVLQDLLRSVATRPAWRSTRIEDPRRVFDGVVARFGLTGAASMLAHLEGSIADWPGPVAADAAGWKDAVESLVSRWDELADDERFAVLQQASSVLRTTMVNDVESRLR